jgi:hypothetical protein
MTARCYQYPALSRRHRPPTGNHHHHILLRCWVARWLTRATGDKINKTGAGCCCFQCCPPARLTRPGVALFVLTSFGHTHPPPSAIHVTQEDLYSSASSFMAGSCVGPYLSLCVSLSGGCLLASTLCLTSEVELSLRVSNTTKVLGQARAAFVACVCGPNAAACCCCCCERVRADDPQGRKNSVLQPRHIAPAMDCMPSTTRQPLSSLPPPPF